MNNQIGIRPYTPVDYPQVRTLLEEGNLYYEPNDSQKRLDEKISRDPKSIFIAQDLDQIVGTVSLMEDGRMAFIFRLAVRPTHRNRGIGRNLMDKAEEELRSRGHKEINILVEEDNNELKDYYRRQGYEEGHPYRWMAKEVR